MKLASLIPQDDNQVRLGEGRDEGEGKGGRGEEGRREAVAEGGQGESTGEGKEGEGEGGRGGGREGECWRRQKKEKKTHFLPLTTGLVQIALQVALVYATAH